MLRRQAGRLRYEPADRAWFAALTWFIPRRRWAGTFPVTPATPLAWHRKLAARKYDTSKGRKPGRPPALRSVARLAVRLARENPLWGYRRIHGELTKLGAAVASSTIYEILRTAGIDPAPGRSGPTWRQFLHAQTAGILAVDFLHVDTFLLSRLHVLVFIEHGTRRMHLGRRHRSPDRRVDGPAGPQPRHESRHAGRGRPVLDPRPRLELHPLFDAVFEAAGATTLRTAIQAPRMNATCERLIGTLRRKLLDRTLILSQAHLRTVLTEYQAHYNSARPHQGIDQRIPDRAH